MKYIIVILSVLFSTAVFSQALTPSRTTAGITAQDYRLKIPMNFVPPSGPTPTLNGGLTLAGGLFYSTTDSSLYAYDSIHFKFQRLLKLSDTGYLKSLTPPTIWGGINGNINDQLDLIAKFNTKQNTITTGTTAQYFRGDFSLATFPTNVSSFTNDAGYLTTTTGDARYPQLSGSYANPSWITSIVWSKITGTPTTLSGYGITDGVPSSRTLTINGTAFDLTTNRTWSVGTVTSVGVTNGYGINSPTGSPVTTSGSIGLSVDSTSATGLVSKTRLTNALSSVNSWNLGGNNVISLQNFGTTSNFDLPIITNNSEKVRFPAAGGILQGSTSSPQSYINYFLDTTHFNKAIRVGSNSWVGTVQSGFRSALIGVVGSNSLSSDYAFYAANSSGTTLLGARNDGLVFITTNRFTSAKMEVNNGFGIFTMPPSNAAGAFLTLGTENTITSTTGTIYDVQIGANSAGGFFKPTSGSDQYSMLAVAGTIGQSGSATGITRGILESVQYGTGTTPFDFRAIETLHPKVFFAGNRMDSSLTVTTTNTTPTVLYTIPTSTGQDFIGQIRIVAKDGSNNKAFIVRQIYASNVSGTVTITDFQGIGTDKIATALVGCDVTATVSGTNILINAVGISGTVLWKAQPFYSIF